MATPVPAAAATTTSAHQSAAERLIHATETGLKSLASLDPRVAALNLAFSVAVLLVAWLAIGLLRRLFDRLLRRMVDPDAPPAAADAPQAAGLTWLLIRLTVFCGAVVSVGAIWGLNVSALMAGQGAGGGLLRAIVVVIFATGAFEVAGFVVDRVIADFARRNGDTRRAAQLRSLGPLVRGLIQTVLVVVSTLTFLSEIGVKVGPLLASAGVVGVAIGFGAQTLVKDFLTGIFLIAEDVVSLGDNVRIGEFGGTVEAMTLRTIRLRDQDSTLHIFPYSEAQVIHNRTKTFSSYVFEAMVTYGTDLDHAFAVIEKVAEQMRREPAFKSQITRPCEILGVDRLDPLGVLIKARLTTLPRSQWAVGREFNLRLKKAFEAEGVELAYRPPGPPAPTVATAAPEPPAAKAQP